MSFIDNISIHNKPDHELEALIRAMLSKNPKYYTDATAFFEWHKDCFCARPRDAFEEKFRHPAMLCEVSLVREHVETLSADQWDVPSLKNLTLNASSIFPDTNLDDQSSSKGFNQCLLYYLRWALLGGRSGPGLPDTMMYLGREETLRRLASAESAFSLENTEQHPSH
ncbi:uncharacterized protein KY384_004821 [Bacidia gigantensis]|uniref:uncharacterized protein n=1 Tax=Bacidia gigantensis TaxID=2732470 RepID=UPI001D03619D|nr:uncharacterized protein KY384_004821 [Bacidia gigantensis]KAG8530319.1 hypothetical protein KY384_004821 [Bacidia gigantensis]